MWPAEKKGNFLFSQRATVKGVLPVGSPREATLLVICCVSVKRRIFHIVPFARRPYWSFAVFLLKGGYSIMCPSRCAPTCDAPLIEMHPYLRCALTCEAPLLEMSPYLRCALTSCPTNSSKPKTPHSILYRAFYRA